jgi:hypothetical protein
MVYIARIGSKHESECLFQNLTTNIVEVQTIRGIVLLGRDFNVRTTTLQNTINISNLCELLQVLELVEIKQPSAVDANVSGWGHELLDLCYDDGLLIFNGWTPGNESGEYTCLANGEHNIVDYIVNSLTI